jgi:hypothetical protein
VTSRTVKVDPEKPGVTEGFCPCTRLLTCLALLGLLLSGNIACGQAETRPAQAPLIQWSNHLDTSGLPAISETSGQIAVAVSVNALDSPSEIHILEPKAQEPIEVFRLRERMSRPLPISDDQQETGFPVAEVNSWLMDRRFRPMERVFGPRQPWHKRPAGVAVETMQSDRWTAEFDWHSQLLTLTDRDIGRLRLKLQTAWETVTFIRQLDRLCAGRGMPSGLWIDATGQFLAIKVSRSYSSGHYCDFPDQWLALKLEPDEPLIQISESFEPPLEVWIEEVEATGPAPIEVGVPFSVTGAHSPGESVVYRWELTAQPANSGALLFEAGGRNAELIADRPGRYELELFVTSGRNTSETIPLQFVASGALAPAAMIGPEGGAVGMPDGTAVLVPSGAVDHAVEFRISPLPPPDPSTLPEDSIVAGPIYDLQPEDLPFQRFVLLIFPFDIPEETAAGEEREFLLHRQTEDKYHLLGSTIGSPLFHSQRIDGKRRLIRYWAMSL